MLLSRAAYSVYIFIHTVHTLYSAGYLTEEIWVKYFGQE